MSKVRSEDPSSTITISKLPTWHDNLLGINELDTEGFREYTSGIGKEVLRMYHEMTKKGLECTVMLGYGVFDVSFLNQSVSQGVLEYMHHKAQGEVCNSCYGSRTYRNVEVSIGYYTSTVRDTFLHCIRVKEHSHLQQVEGGVRVEVVSEVVIVLAVVVVAAVIVVEDEVPVVVVIVIVV